MQLCSRFLTKAGGELRNGKTISNFNVTKATEDTVNEKQLVIVLPFLGSQSFSGRKQLQSCKPFVTLFIKIVFQSKTRLSSLFRFKDIIPKEMR